MRQYVPKLRLYFKGSEAMQATLAELQQLLGMQSDAADGGAASGDAAGQQRHTERRRDVSKVPLTAPAP